MGRRNFGRRAATGLAALAALAAAYAVWRSTLVTKSGPLEEGLLVVMPISVEEPQPRSDWLRHGLAEMIRSQLGQTPGVHVVARHRVATALRETGYDEDAPSPEVAEGIAQRLRAERLVTGSFVRVDDSFVMSAEMVDVASGQTEGTASVRGRHPADLLDAVDELCLNLLHAIGPESRRGAAGGPWRPARLATRSIDASRRYLEALSLYARGGLAGTEQAEKRLDEALELDPAFAQAYVKKAEILHWRRRWGYGRPDPAPAVLAAARLVRELPHRERLLVLSFENLIIRQQPELALREWESLLRLHPTYAQEVGVPSLAADTLLRLGRWNDLILVGEAHVDSASLPDSERALLSHLLSQAYRRRGEFERARQNARRAVRLWPSQEGPRFLSQRAWLGRVSLEAAQREAGLAELRAVCAAPEAEATNLSDAAWGLYMAGEPVEAGQAVERALALDPAYGNAYHLRGWLSLARGELARAAADFRISFERTPVSFGSPHLGTVGGDLAALYYAGVAYQKLGHEATARATFEELIEHGQALLQRPDGLGAAATWQVANFQARAAARLGRPAREPPHLAGDESTYYVQMARLHAVQGRREQALRELGQGLALGFGEQRHILDDPDFESLRDVPGFARLVAAPR